MPQPCESGQNWMNIYSDTIRSEACVGRVGQHWINGCYVFNLMNHARLFCLEIIQWTLTIEMIFYLLNLKTQWNITGNFLPIFIDFDLGSILGHESGIKAIRSTYNRTSTLFFSIKHHTIFNFFKKLKKAANRDLPSWNDFLDNPYFTPVETASKVMLTLMVCS